MTKKTGKNELNKEDLTLKQASVKTETNKNDLPFTEEAKSFIDIMYDKVNEVIGGDNKSQFFCMGIPGTSIAPEMYKYDYKNHEPKPPYVEANESRLVNKLFDACQVTGSDNGRSLAQQYQSAIDMLTPKLNGKIAEAKNLLRDLLMSPYPYDFGHGLQTGLTLQQVFYQLYDEWVAQKMEWMKLQSSKKEELHNKYPGDDDASNKKYQNEYLTWYQDVADGYLEQLNEKMGKILAVFSPNDMKIIEGILDSGSGAELQEAREVLFNARKANPDGGYTYPVTLYPENWFELLDNSFTGIDLLQSPAALSEQMMALTIQKNNLIAQINQITAAIPSTEDINHAQAAVKASKEKLDKASADLISAYGSGAATVFTTVLDIINAVKGNKAEDSVITRLAAAAGVNTSDGNFIEKLQTAVKAADTAQTDLVNASQELADAQLKSAELNNLANMKDLIIPLQTKLENLKAEIAVLGTNIATAQAVNAADKPNNTTDDVVPNKVPKGFTQIVIEESASTMDTATSKSASSSASSYGVNFFFGGYTNSQSSSESSYKSFTEDNSCKIQIGMSVAKVKINREWFNPGLFSLSGDMCNVTTQKFAPSGDYPQGFNPERFAEMNKTIFSCFPTAFVVARDVTMKLVTSNSFSDQTAQSMEKHASSGGGFLFFRGSSSSSSSSSSSNAHVSASDKSITVRFTDPQIIGYYIEATASDKSVYIDDLSKDKNAGYVTIMDFVSKYKEILKAYSQKNVVTP